MLLLEYFFKSKFRHVKASRRRISLPKTHLLMQAINFNVLLRACLQAWSHNIQVFASSWFAGFLFVAFALCRHLGSLC
jgi:hypothetical protein